MRVAWLLVAGSLLVDNLLTVDLLWLLHDRNSCSCTSCERHHFQLLLSSASYAAANEDNEENERKDTVETPEENV